MTRKTTLALIGIASTLCVAAPAFPDSANLETQKSPQYGTYIADSTGRALYMFEADKQGNDRARANSNCYDACARAWPPLLAESAGAQAQADQSKLGTTERKDGKKQVTYNGWPLYYYVNDKRSGDTKGQDIKAFGGEWYLVTPRGEKAEKGS